MAQVPEQKVMHTFAELSDWALKDVYLGPLYDLAFDIERSWLAKRIKRRTDVVQGLSARLPFLRKYGWSWRPVSRFGYLPTGSKMDGGYMTFRLGIHGANVMVSFEEILDTEGNNSLIGDIMEREMTGVAKTLPYYNRAQIWTPESAVMGVVSTQVSTVVTLSNTGLWNTLQADRCKLFIEGMWVQFLSSTGESRGAPREITYVDYDAGAITVDSAITLSSGDLVVLTDAAGLESAYQNQQTPGIFDIVGDDNTIQGVDRSSNENRRLRAVVHDNGGVARDVTRDLLRQFFHDCFDPAEAFTHYDQLENIFKILVLDEDSRRFVNTREYVDGFTTLKVGQTRIVESDDCDRDKVVVLDWDNVYIADKGKVGDFFGRGWFPLNERPFMSRNLQCAFRMVVEDPRKCGALKDLNV